MARRSTFIALVERLGCDAYEDGFAILVDAPSGKAFGCDPSITCLVAPFADGEQTKPEAYADLIDRLSYGLVEADWRDA